MVMNFGIKHQIKRYAKIADTIMQRTQDYQKLANDQFKVETQHFKERMQRGENVNDLLVDAYALVGAAATHVLGMTPYKVQIIGAIILNHNMIAEMRTGEGKTLTATMPLYLNALNGLGSHLITANPYLAARDAKELTPLYETLGMTVGVNRADDKLEDKQKAYRTDIMYTTGDAVGFDYLNDNLAKSVGELCQQNFNYVLIDEADSILLDNANTPLIISGAGMDLGDEYQKADAFVRYQLDPKSVLVERELHTARLKPSGVMAAKQAYGDDLFENQRDNVHYLTNAVQAYYLYENGNEYLTRRSKKEGVRTVELIDANTGRVLEGQRFSEGIHQALEAKEGVLIHSPNMTSASITYQSLFNMYHKVAGMTGTAMTDREELDAIYDLGVLPVPTNKPDRRVDYPDQIYANQKEKFTAVVQAIVAYHDRKQPVLVGTESLNDSEKLSRLLSLEGIEHELLNANNPEHEAKIISRAGHKGAVTIATNMAGRGTDIKLEPGVNELGGLVVIGTQRHSSPRIDNQLRGRAARQGQRGITQFFVALDDELFKKCSPNSLARYQKKYRNYHGAIPNHRLDKLFDTAQREVATRNYENRKSDLTYESIIATERDAIYEQRQAFLDRKVDMRDFMIKAVKRVIHDYFKPLQKEKVTHALIQQIQHDFINQNLSANLLSLGNVEHYPTVADIEKKVEQAALHELDMRNHVLSKQFNDSISRIALEVTDFYWSKEIAVLNDLKRTITLEGYRQANPYVEYQRKAADSYEKLLDKIRQVIVRIFYQTQFYQFEAPADESTDATAESSANTSESSSAAPPTNPETKYLAQKLAQDAAQAQKGDIQDA